MIDQTIPRRFLEKLGDGGLEVHWYD